MEEKKGVVKANSKRKIFFFTLTTVVKVVSLKCSITIIIINNCMVLTYTK